MLFSLQLGLVYLISEVLLTLLRQLRRAGSEENLRMRPSLPHGGHCINLGP